MLQPDPLDLDGLHGYAYADDNPMDEYDLMGLFDCPSQRIRWLFGTGKALHGLCMYLDKVLLPAIGLQGGIDQLVGVVDGTVVSTYHRLHAHCREGPHLLRPSSATHGCWCIMLTRLL